MFLLGHFLLREISIAIYLELENLAIENPWFRMDGAPHPYYIRVITYFLYRTFADRWIGRFGLFSLATEIT